MPNIAKIFISTASFLLLFFVFSATVPGIEKKDGKEPTVTAPESYVINARYLMGCDYYNQAVRYSNNQQYDKALASFRKAVELLPKGHPGYVLSEIEIQRLTDPGFLEEKKKKYEAILTEDITQQLGEIEKEARKIVGIPVEEEPQPTYENQEAEREKRLKKAARQIALELAIENLKKQLEMEKETPEIASSQGTSTDKEEGTLKEKIKSLVDREFEIKK